MYKCYVLWVRMYIDMVWKGNRFYSYCSYISVYSELRKWSVTSLDCALGEEEKKNPSRPTCNKGRTGSFLLGNTERPKAPKRPQYWTLHRRVGRSVLPNKKGAVRPWLKKVLGTNHSVAVPLGYGIGPVRPDYGISETQAAAGKLPVSRIGVEMKSHVAFSY